ncbi:uncharacterized protein LOC132201244 isoform X2 [Neocloeon triangulifer]|uniref:uncharacterized protein LOC132201244 isoform X2 n=1 Tax=Neocloeon triangulifer TaxID=2078957 RepID=UPI00286F702F|nr:uncharacterized protein LOC132201244 isoform X2 [Neocloeon triangulifer]
MSISGRCRFVVGTLDGKRVSYIIDEPVQQNRPLSSSKAQSKPSSEFFSSNRPASTSASSVHHEEEDDEAKINASVVLSNQQLDDLMDILHHVNDQQQNKQAWSEDEQYVKECQSAVHEEPTKDSSDHESSRDSGYFGTGVMSGRPSLIELKKQQWAKEKVEMQGLLSPWGQAESPKTSSYQDAYSLQLQPENGVDKTIPIITYNNKEKEYFDSNYPSDMSYSHTPASRMSRSPANHDGRSIRVNGGGDEGRLKWGDRGVAVGHLWEPSTSPSRLPEPQRSSPAWLEKSLGHNAGDVENVIHSRKVYIDASEMEERELKRKKALENQQCIRQQLEERDRQRKEEREKRILEEKVEEERIRKENAIIEERYRQERNREKKKGEEENKEHEKQQHPGRSTKQSKGWNKKEASPRSRNRQRRETETYAQLQRRSQIFPSHEPEILTLHHPAEESNTAVQNFSINEEYKRVHQDYGAKPINIPIKIEGGDDEMILLGKEVAVLLAPELERRILMSRSGRDVATQTDISQVFTRHNKKQPQQQLMLSNQPRPIWGANRTDKKYMKQSDKDIYRIRCSSLNSRSKVTTDSTDESDKYPRSSSPPQLDRRKRAQSLGKNKNSNNLQRSSEDDSAYYEGRRPRREMWQERNNVKVPAPLSWHVDINDAPPHQPKRAPARRITANSPPVPTLQTKTKPAPEERQKSPSPRPTPVACPPSPPVPAVLRQLQEQVLPPLNHEIKVLRSAPPVLKSLPLQRDEDDKVALPEIKQNLINLPSDSSDLLSQLSTIRRNLQNKHSEWQALTDEAE